MGIIKFDWEFTNCMHSIKESIRFHAMALGTQNKIAILKELHETKTISTMEYTEKLKELYKNT